MLSCSRPRRIAVFAVVAAVLIGGEARAADTGNGSKNFNTPRSVPNYFSNEAGPLLGPTSETQRGPLYMGQTYGSMQPAGQARAAVAIAAPHYRQHVAMAEPRGRLIRGRRGRVVVAHHVIVHGRLVARVVAHGSAHSHTSRVVHRAAAHTATGHAVRARSAHHRHTRS